MNCSNCGTIISNDTDICPNCGANVRAQLENTESDEILEITENMAAPQLEINQENMTSGVGDLSSGENASIYAPGENIPSEEGNQNNNTNNDRVDFSIPTVQETLNVEMPSDGSAPEIAVETNNIDITDHTSDNNSSDVTELKIGGKTLKIKMGKSLGLPIVIAIALLTLIIGLFLGKILFSKNYCSTNTTRPQVIDNKTKMVSDGKNNITNVGNYTYKIPTDYTYDKSNGGLFIYGKNDTFRIFIRTDRANFSDLSGAKTSIRETLKESGTEVTNIRELNILKTNVLAIETLYKNSNKLVAFADAANGYVYFIEIVDSTNNFNYDLLDRAIDIVNNSTYESVESNMEKMEVNDISKLALKAASEYKNLIKK